jgi:hypothetical protein
MKTILIIFSFLFLLSCEKDDNETADTIVSGRIVQDCNGTPLANKNIEAWVKLSGTCSSLTGCTELLYTTTDADGNFSFKTKKGSMEIRLKGSSTILYGIPILNHVNIGTFNAFPSTSFVYRIKVNNPYNVGDTLVTDLKGYGIAGRYKFPAPLTDTSFIITNYTVLDSPDFSNIGFISVEIGYGIYKNSINVANNWYNTYTNKSYNVAICQTPNNQEIVLEIN